MSVRGLIPILAVAGAGWWAMSKKESGKDEPDDDDDLPDFDVDDESKEDAKEG